MLGLPPFTTGLAILPAAPSVSLAPMQLAAAIVPPALLLVLCVVAGIGTVLLLPSRREAALRKIGGAILLAAAIIFAVLLIRAAAGSGQEHGDRGGMGVYFWVFTAIALLSAMRVITHPRPVYSALYFVMTVFASAGLFVLMWAEFMAVALVLIYAGAILVTYVFVIMLAAEATPTSGPMAGLAEHDAISREPLMAAAVGFALMGVLLFVIFDKAEGVVKFAKPQGSDLGIQPHSSVAPEFAVMADIGPGTQPAESEPAVALPATVAQFQPQGGVQQLGVYLFESHLVNLELAGLILTVAMVGAIVIARRRVVGTEQSARAISGGEMLTAPATPIADDPHSIPVYGTDNPRQKAFPET